MKRVTTETFLARNGVVGYPTYSIFLDSPCISFDSPACVSVQLFRRPPDHTRLFPQDCETSVMRRLLTQAGVIRHRHCLGS